MALHAFESGRRKINGCYLKKRMGETQELLQEQCSAFELRIAQQIDQLITALQERKRALLDFAHNERDFKVRSVEKCTNERCIITSSTVSSRSK